MAKVQSGKTYIGVVEENNDPKKIGRVKIRVLDIFDETPIEDIPWANPWKDLGGNEFNIPDIGKVVTVIFDSGNENSPEFISSDHYNVNIEKKLKDLQESDYLSMKSLLFDHKTQIYVNDSEGLKIDHKFNLINIKENGINLELKDNFGKINLGTADSNQRVILGDNFLNWFDDFIDILSGGQGGPFLGNLSAPVIATPALLANLEKYSLMKDPKFLSKNVYAVDNENISKLDRIADGQKGDDWKSTTKENNLTTKEDITYKAVDGSTSTTFEQPSDSSDLNPDNPTISNNPIKPVPSDNPDVAVIIELFKLKGYILYQDTNKVNILAIRNQCVKNGDKYTDQFVDKLYVLYKKEDSSWDLKQWMFSTVPGLQFTITEKWLTEKGLVDKNPWIGSIGKNIYIKEWAKVCGEVNGNINFKGGLPILAPSQYIDLYFISKWKGVKSMGIIKGANQLVYRDNDISQIDIFNPYNISNPEIITPDSNIDGISIHMGYPSGLKVGNWSEGDQVFSSETSLNEFFKICQKHSDNWGNKFTYTLATKTDWDIASDNVSSNITTTF